MIKYLQESNGNKSSTRLIFFIGSIWTMFIVTYLVFKGAEPMEVIAVFAALMGVFTGLKLGQKSMEEKK